MKHLPCSHLQRMWPSLKNTRFQRRIFLCESWEQNITSSTQKCHLTCNVKYRLSGYIALGLEQVSQSCQCQEQNCPVDALVAPASPLADRWWVIRGCLAATWEFKQPWHVDNGNQHLFHQKTKASAWQRYWLITPILYQFQCFIFPHWTPAEQPYVSNYP